MYVFGFQSFCFICDLASLNPYRFPIPILIANYEYFRSLHGNAILVKPSYQEKKVKTVSENFKFYKYTIFRNNLANEKFKYEAETVQR